MTESINEHESPDLDVEEALSSADGAEDDGGEAGTGPEQARGRRRRRRRKEPEALVPEDEQSARALAFMVEVIQQMGLDCRVHLRASREDEEDKDIRLELTGNDAARIIGKRGQTLSALQFLANRVLNRPGQERRYVTVDAEGYRSRRDSSLAAMAKRLGNQVATDGKIITFEPMSPRDRRVVHLALAKFEGVITKSEGDGEDRRVQIIPVRRGANPAS